MSPNATAASSPINAPCSTRYLPAAHDSGPRATTRLRWVVLHDEEAPTAESAAAWFQNPASGGSAHLCVDDVACYRCVRNDTVAWGAASSFSANRLGLHIEQAGFAIWKPWEWRRHLRTIDRAAFKTAVLCKAFHIPPVWLNASDLPRRSGITTHRAVSAASRRDDPAHAWVYSHSDPGAWYPSRYFMRRVRRHWPAA